VAVRVGGLLPSISPALVLVPLVPVPLVPVSLMPVPPEQASSSPAQAPEPAYR